MPGKTASVYITDDFSEPMTAQHNFANTFDLEHPEEAMTAYQRIMHEHTKRQLANATKSARRRTGSASSSLHSAESIDSSDA